MDVKSTKEQKKEMHANIDAFLRFPLSPGDLLCASIISILLISGWRWHQRHRPAVKSSHGGDIEALKISPLQDFDWQTTEPLQLRPFRGKDKYYLTMGLFFLLSFTSTSCIIYKAGKYTPNKHTTSNRNPRPIRPHPNGQNLQRPSRLPHLSTGAAP